MNDEPSHSDEELLALLQPPTMPEELDFEPGGLMKDTSDEDEDDQPLPGLAPPAAPQDPTMEAPVAPIAQMDLTDTIDSSRLNVPSSDALDDSRKEVGSSQPESVTNEPQEQDEDEIAYEPIKTPSRTPRSAKARTSATRPSSRRKLASSRVKPRSQDKVVIDLEGEYADKAESKLKAEAKAETGPEPEPEQMTEPPKPPSLDFEIVIRSISSQAMQEYEPIAPGDYIYRVLERIPTGVPGETWLSVEFEDGHIDQVSACVQNYRLIKTNVSEGIRR